MINTYNETVIASWYLDCAMQLSDNFGRVELDHEKLGWVGIHEFNLPKTFRQTTNPLLIVTPGKDIDLSDKYEFYLSKKVNLAYRPKNNHLYKNDGYNQRYDQGFSRISFHLENINPAYPIQNGDTLLDICIALYTFLGTKW